MYSETKKCFKCGESKTRADFYAHARMADGLLGKCKTCTKRDARAHRSENIERIREYDRGRGHLPHRVEARKQYQATPQGKAAVAKGSRAYADRNPHKKSATTAVNNAVRDGRLTKSPCEICGNSKAQAHHDDYSKPLDVRWLCVKHHSEWHKHNKAKG